jgi:hypothetical protein
MVAWRAAAARHRDSGFRLRYVSLHTSQRGNVGLRLPELCYVA